MKIREVNENKKQFISLLLLADEQESMVDRYLEKGIIFSYNPPITIYLEPNMAASHIPFRLVPKLQ